MRTTCFQKHRCCLLAGLAGVLLWGFAGACLGDEPSADNKQSTPRKAVKRVLLLGQKPDGHPWSTHEYLAGVHLLAACLQPVDGLQTVVVQADDPWTEGPELLDGADGVVVFLSEGAKWIGADPKRLAAFQRLAQRGGGLVCLHWGMGCREAKYVEDYVALFGGCHGGPDRKFQVITAPARLATPGHPVLRGLDQTPFDTREEYYYRLKFPKPPAQITPLIQVPIDNELHPVAWAWQRPDGGRSGGFSGGHFHDNWKLPAYRRLMTQSVLWSLDLPIPDAGVAVDVNEKLLKLQRPEAGGQRSGEERIEDGK